MRSINTLLAFAVLGLGATQLSCSINQYCVGCEVDDGGGGSGDMDAGMDGNGTDDSMMVDAGCLPTGPEICDGTDNDCNGFIDDGTLPTVGDTCDNVMGACAAGVKICSQGAIRCDKLPTPEICDGIDNNCNGMVDDGNPGGGGKCGTDVGECVAGTLNCNATSGCISTSNCNPLTQNCCVTCDNFIDTRTAMETCDGEDDDCDGSFDEGLTNLGACGPTTNEGECTIGTLVCQGGGTVCSNAVFPKFELCNDLDDDCDMGIDEIFDLETDPRNCGTCGTVCPASSRTCINSSNASASCTMESDCPGGTCAINSQPTCAPDMANMGTCGYSCNPGFVDRDGTAANGCEYRCFPTGAEVCDGVDNDCDGMIDNGLTPPVGLCLTGGECGGGETGVQCDNAVDDDVDGRVNDGCPAVGPAETGAQCDDAIDSDSDGVVNDGCPAPPTTVPACMGVQGWRCSYPGTTQFPSETRCDGLNNDCDANIDENQPNLGEACSDGGVGVCRGTGTFACNTTSELTRNGPATCGVTSPGQMTPDANETCDDKDNDCDGKTDEGSETGSLLGQQWVTIGNGLQIMQYEASRRDATDTQQGTRAGVVAATIAASPTGATQSGATATFTTLAPHALAMGTKVRVSGVGVLGYNGLWTIASVPTTTTFTVTLPTTGLAASGNGTVTRYVGACSKAGAIPWTNVTYPEALAVCEAMGASLCSETRWHQACSVVPPVATPVAISNTTSSSGGTMIQAEDFHQNVFAGVPSHSWQEDYTVANPNLTFPQQHMGIANMRALPNSGASITLGSALASAPYLQYEVNIPQTATNWRLWVRMYSPTGSDNTLHVGVSTSATAVAPTTTLTTSTNGTWRWQSTGDLSLSAGTNYVRLFMAEDGMKVDAFFLGRTSTPQPPCANGTSSSTASCTVSDGGTWSYATNADTYQATTCNGADRNATNDAIMATGANASCYADHTAGDVFDLSGNVKEWTLARLPGQNPIRGGASNDTAVGTSCSLNFILGTDSFFFPNVGFRCCR